MSLAELARLAAERPAVVLDDDPTGTQTLRDVPVLTAWTADDIARHLEGPVVFLSTNSRSLEEEAAVALAREAVSAALAAARRVGRTLSFVSRSDSTLRGHFPAETAAIADAAGMLEARILLAPYFGEGGRVTVYDVHYLEREGRRVPVGETEFARDAVFGYRASDLREWVAEKYAAAGRPAPPLVSLSLDVVRAGAEHVADRLAAMPPGGVAVANAETDADIESVALGALLSEQVGLPLVARVAASYVRARAGRPPARLLRPDELDVPGAGLVVVGSHVDTTTRQLEQLIATEELLDLHEVALEPLLASNEAAVTAVARAVDRTLGQGRHAVVFTERRSRELDLAAARAISRSLADMVARVEARPAWVLAKGGITSSDVAVHGLAMREARVAGQLLPGVPVWVGRPGSRWPGLPLIVFPGNVGPADALSTAVAKLGGPG